MKKIDLSRFTGQIEALVPIVNGKGRFDGRVVKSNVADGWYLVKFSNEIEVSREARPAEIAKAYSDMKGLKFYPLGAEGIPVNFANFFGRGEGGSININFLNLEPFKVAKVIGVGEGGWYFIGEDPRFQRSLLTQLRDAFINETSIEGIKGITPELRYYFLILSMQRDAFKAAEELEKMQLAQAEREKRIAEFQKTFAGRLKSTIEQADGELVTFYKMNATSWMVHWKVRGSNQLVKSTIRDDMKILSLGFCASGEDKKHWIDGAVQLAKSYGNLYITRD